VCCAVLCCAVLCCAGAAAAGIKPSVRGGLPGRPRPRSAGRAPCGTSPERTGAGTPWAPDRAARTACSAPRGRGTAPGTRGCHRPAAGRRAPRTRTGARSSRGPAAREGRRRRCALVGVRSRQRSVRCRSRRGRYLDRAVPTQAGDRHRRLAGRAGRQVPGAIERQRLVQLPHLRRSLRAGLPSRYQQALVRLPATAARACTCEGASQGAAAYYLPPAPPPRLTCTAGAAAGTSCRRRPPPPAGSSPAGGGGGWYSATAGGSGSWQAAAEHTCPQGSAVPQGSAQAGLRPWPAPAAGPGQGPKWHLRGSRQASH
jgi:hypothetical protein